MKNLFLFLCIILGATTCFSQKVVNNVVLFDIDDRYNEVDTVMLKNNISTVNAYRCNNSQDSKDSCSLFSKKIYDKSGRLIQLIKGDNLTDNIVDYFVSYKKLSDSLFESTVKYPPNSKMIPDNFYVDTVIKKTTKRVCLYKSDKNKYIYVRSLYTLNSNGNLIDIKRYDLNNKLVQIYYPFDGRKPKDEWFDVSVSKMDSTVIRYILYDENEFTSYIVYNSKGKITEIREVNNTFSNNDSSFIRKIIIYDSEGHQIIRTTVDENNQLISEERFYYRGKNLVKYTEDDNLNDSFIREEKIFNEIGQMVLYKSYNRYSRSVTIWKFYYDAKGLLTKEEYLLDEMPQLIRMYKYK